MGMCCVVDIKLTVYNDSDRLHIPQVLLSRFLLSCGVAII
nr:MAG TPA: hypothetical protein [Caudoviricetes sp.]